MLEGWKKFFQMSVICAMATGGALCSFADEPVPEGTNQQIYLSQMEKYPVLSKEFKKEIDANAHPPAAPAEGENLFLWQMAEYKTLNSGFSEVYAANLAEREVPETPEELYLWQLEEYPKLDKQYYNEHRREF